MEFGDGSIRNVDRAAPLRIVYKNARVIFRLRALTERLCAEGKLPGEDKERHRRILDKIAENDAGAQLQKKKEYA